MNGYLNPRDILLLLARKKFEDDKITREDIKKLTGFKTPKQQRYFYRAMQYFEPKEI
jgi:hypothetical protein